MRKIFAVLYIVITGLGVNLWGASGEYSDGCFVGISESTHNLLKGKIRNGSLMKSLSPTKDTPILMWIKVIGSSSMDITKKADQVRDFWVVLRMLEVRSFLRSVASLIQHLNYRL